VESGVLGGLLLTAAVSAIVGSPAMLVCAVVGAWLCLAAVVGLRNVLDAGCYFMLLVVGVIVVVELALDGPGALLP
jgi:Ca2+/Na+ antiporter